jgi:hypothetical protein
MASTRWHRSGALRRTVAAKISSDMVMVMSDMMKMSSTFYQQFLKWNPAYL